MIGQSPSFVHRDRAISHELQSTVVAESSRLSDVCCGPSVTAMETATDRSMSPTLLSTAVATLIAALVAASAVHAAAPVAAPASPPVASTTTTIALKATRFVSIGLGGSDALSVATDRCVQRIEARSGAALASCKLAVRRARTYSFDPVAATFAGNAARRDYAYALGNYAVAQTLAGDAQAAQATTLLALQYSPEEPTLASNLAVLEARRLAATSTVSTVK